MFILRCSSIKQSVRLYSSAFLESKHEEIQDLCRKYAKNVLRPVAGELDRKGCFPKRYIDELGQMGLMAITAPKKYGGAELDMLSASIAVEELSRGCASTGVIVSIHNILYIDFLATNGTDEQKLKYLKPYTQGIPGAFALSEAEAGSDVANIAATAEKNGDCYILNGIKTWVTSGSQSEHAIIFATVDKKLGRRGITPFIVPLKADGVQLSESDEKLGIRATSTNQISLSDVAIPCENIVGHVGEGFKLAMQQLNKARIGIASQALGIAQASLDLALDYATRRCAFGQRLVDMQAVQLRLARSAAQIEAARLLVRNSARLCDEGVNMIKNSAIAKLVASETATYCAHHCIQILGGMGYSQSMPAERYYRDARITEIYGGVSDIQMLVIAESLLKEAENTSA